ncbi:hypothetical protein SAMN05216459_13630 [Ensifer sp. OV372]|jgi:hypothetical protein|nr:hypothetical protein DEU52_11896 [Ensifer adhaerens]SFH46986.1 hypothetical protein SAMN05216459_13630 [Ensifer sp. OV372]
MNNPRATSLREGFKRVPNERSAGLNSKKEAPWQKGRNVSRSVREAPTAKARERNKTLRHEVSRYGRDRANPLLAHPHLFNVEACKHGRMSSGMKRLTTTSIAAAKQEAIEAAGVAADTVSAGAFLGPGG